MPAIALTNHTLCIYTTTLEPILAKISEKIQLAPPRRRATKRHCLAEKLPFSLRIKKSARAESKNVKAIFLLGSALNRADGGTSLRLAGKNFPPQTPPIFARSLEMKIVMIFLIGGGNSLSSSILDQHLILNHL